MSRASERDFFDPDLLWHKIRIYSCKIYQFFESIFDEINLLIFNSLVLTKRRECRQMVLTYVHKLKIIHSIEMYQINNSKFKHLDQTLYIDVVSTSEH